jgi:hypothetical protein
MSEIKWDVGGKVYTKYTEIWNFLFNPEGQEIISNDAQKSLNGEHLPTKNGGYSMFEKMLFSQSYKDGYKAGFSRGFREGAQAMEIEIKDK